MIFRFLFHLFFFAVLPALAFYFGYRGTDHYFQSKMIALPFELFGVAVGLGFFCWSLTLGIIIRSLTVKRRSLP